MLGMHVEFTMANNKHTCKFMNDSDDFSLNPNAFNFIPCARGFSRGPFPKWRRSDDPPLPGCYLPRFQAHGYCLFPTLLCPVLQPTTNLISLLPPYELLYLLVRCPLPNLVPLPLL